MSAGKQDLSASRWASTSRNTSTFKRSFNTSLGHSSGFSASVSNSTAISSPATKPTGEILSNGAVSANRNVKLTPDQRDFQTRNQSYHIFTKYLRRLKWKAIGLHDSHQRTLQIIHNNNHNGPSIPMNSIAGKDFVLQPGEPETMFKIDFFEFYTILENALVSLLKVFGMEVSPMHGVNVHHIDGDGARHENSQNSRNAMTGTTNATSATAIANSDETNRHKSSLIGDSKTIHKSKYHHSYHANVLLALDEDTCPLKDIMGQGLVRDYLGIAKEWRNKWKNVEDEGKDERDDDLIGSRYERYIQDLRLEEMLRDILVAVEEGGVLARQTLKSILDDLQRDGLQISSSSVGDGTGAGAGAGNMMDIDDRGFDATAMLDVDDMMDLG